jgi:hypothetical protein
MAKSKVQFEDDAPVDIMQLKKDAEKQIKDFSTEPVERVELTPREISFNIVYDAPDGNTYETALKSAVLNADGRLLKTKILTQLSRGMNPDLLPQDERVRLDYIARCAVQLKDPPKWLTDGIGEDNELLIQVVSVLLEHESRFFRGNSRKGGEGEIKTRVSVIVPAFDKAGTT